MVCTLVFACFRPVIRNLDIPQLIIDHPEIVAYSRVVLRRPGVFVRVYSAMAAGGEA